jgi:hypothetical protein
VWSPLAACWVRRRATPGPMSASRQAASAEKEKKIDPKPSNCDRTGIQTLTYGHVDQIREDQARGDTTNTLGSTTPMA